MMLILYTFFLAYARLFCKYFYQRRKKFVKWEEKRRGGLLFEDGYDILYKILSFEGNEEHEASLS